MTGYLIHHTGRREDALVSDPDRELYPHFIDGWLAITDHPLHIPDEHGTVHYAAPRDHIASIQRVDDTTQPEG